MNSDSPAPQRARQVHGERGHSGGGAALGGRRRTVGGRGRQSLDPPAAPGHTQLSNREQPHGADQHGEQRESRAQPAALVFDGQRAAEGRQGEQQQGAGGQPQRHRVPGRLGRGQPLGADQVAGQGRHLCRGGRVAQPVLPRAGRPQLAGHGGQADRANQRPQAGQHGEQQGQRVCAARPAERRAATHARHAAGRCRTCAAPRSCPASWPGRSPARTRPVAGRRAAPAGLRGSGS